MARGAPFGFDVNDPLLDVGGIFPTGVTSSTTTPNGIGRSLKFQPASGSSVSNVQQVTAGLANPRWQKYDIKFDVLPTTTARIFLGGTGGSNLRINPDGTVGFFTLSTLRATSSAGFGDLGWHTLEVRSDAADTSQDRLRIDGVVQVTTAFGETFTEVLGCNDTVADTYTMYVDNYVTDSVTWPGPAYVGLLLPISDSARAALWTAGHAGTTDLWEAVNNTPPTGIATPNGVTNAVTHGGGAAGSTDDYDANMLSYSSAGIVAGSTINAIQAVVAHGEDIATGAKLLTFSVKSNPAQGAFETNFNAGTGAVGTYPTNWLTTRGTIIQSPSVVLGTSPVMTVRRPETASRRADVCFMGIYVDYTPAVAAAEISGRPVVTMSQAVHRAAHY